MEAVVQRSSVKKVFLKISQNAKENTIDKVSFLIQFAGGAGNFIKKETLEQMLSSEFYEIFKNFFLQNNSGGCFWKYVSETNRKISSRYKPIFNQCSIFTSPKNI